MQETWETQFQSLGQKDDLEKEMATLSSILALGLQRVVWVTEHAVGRPLQSLSAGLRGWDATMMTRCYQWWPWVILVYIEAYFWLHWVFIAVCRLSLVVAMGLLSGCGAWASHCSGISCCGAQALGHNPVVVGRGLSCSVACGIFLDQGVNPRPLHWQAES